MRSSASKADGSVVALVLPLVGAGAGLGIVVGPIIALVLATAPPAHAGAASGVLASSQQLGNALGVAGIGIVYYGTADTDPTPTGVAHAAASSHLVLAALGLIDAVALAVLTHPTADEPLPHG